MNSVENLIRKIKLTDFFSQRRPKKYDPHLFVNKFVDNSSWTPPDSFCSLPTQQTIALINENTDNTLRKYIKTGFSMSIKNARNLSTSEYQAISSLRDDANIIIRSADKGGSIVVMDTFLYNREVYRQLNDVKYYRRIDKTVSDLNILKINDIIYRIYDKGFISEKQCSYLLCDIKPRARNFYLLPKVHKEKSKWTHLRMPPGRPIVTCCGTEFDKIGKFIDHFLQPISTIGEAYTKDTYHFISRVRGQTVNSDCFLITADVTSLYTNMDINLTLEVVDRFFQLFPDEQRPSVELLELLNVILHGNDFCFENEWFLQVLGMAMGNPCAPSCANLFLKKMDDAAVHYYLPPLLFSRFLDDIFFVWNSSLDELKKFETYLNSLIPNINLTFTVSPVSVDFLDVTVFKTFENGTCTLQTRPYFKTTDTHQLLHKASFHPKHTFLSIIKSQFIRFKRLSSFKDDYNASCRILSSVLRTRGYSKRLLRSYQNEVWHTYNTSSTLIDTKPEILPMVITYDSVGLQSVRKWRHIISQNATFSSFKLISAYRIHKNLRSLLNRSHNLPLHNVHSPNPGCFRCTSPKCRSCLFMSESLSFFGSVNHRPFSITSRIGCKSSNVVYLITCKKCSMQYVGETGCPLNVRMLNHLSCIKLKKPSPIGLHFNLPDHHISHFSFIAIEQLDSSTTISVRRNRESFWQTILETRYPLGINNFNASFI